MQNVLCKFIWQTSAPMFAGPAKADLGVQVRAIHIDLPAVVMDDLADLPNGLLEHAMRGRIRHHQGGQVVLVRLGFGPQIGDIDVALAVAGDRHDFQAGHHSAGGIGAMGRSRNEADVPVRFPALRVEAADGEQARIFALRTCIGLQGNAGEPGDLGQPLLQLPEKRLVSLRLLDRRERMKFRLNSGQETGNISAAALSFIVQEPSGIIECVSERSRASSLRK